MSKHTRVSWLTLVVALATTATLATQGPAAGPPLAEPGISPDGREVAFVSGGDIWTAPLGGSTPAIARLLVSHPATESRPLFSPTGDAVAFVSNRTGNGDIYVLRFADASLRRLTFDDGPEMLDGWARDGRSVFFSSTTRDIAGMNDVFRVAVDGGTPMPVTSERYTNEFHSATSPDGATIAFSARGIASQQWWRNGHSHIDESEIWTLANARYTRIVERGAKALWPMWSGDGRSLFFMSDRAGAENIWRVNLSNPPNPSNLSNFKAGRVLWPSISADGRTIAFERNFGIWTLDTATGRASELQIELRGVPASPPTEHQRFTNQFSNLRLSPDGKKVAFIVRGEVFAGPSRDGGDAERVTNTAAREFGMTWAGDSRRLFYVSERDGMSHLVTYDFTTRRETVLFTSGDDLGAPVVSPNGSWLAFVEDRSTLNLLGVDSKQRRTLVKGEFLAAFETTASLAWSPDNQWLAFISRGARGFYNVSVASTAQADKPNLQPVSFLANLNTDSVAWSPDGTFLTFATGQRTEPGQVARVDLVLRTPKFREDRFRSLFDEEPPKPREPVKPAEPAKPAEPVKPVKPAEPAIVFENIRQRLSVIPVGVDVQDQVISPDGKTLLVTASAAGQTNLYTYSIDELAREPAVARQLTSTAGSKSNAQFSPDGKEVYYLDAGRANAITVEDRRVRALDLTAAMDVDFARERPAVFQQAWRFLNDYFFDEKHNGVDWAAARASYGARVERTRTPDEMRRVTQLMIGELNASHLGFSAPPGQAVTPFTGRLGVRFDAAEYAKSGRLRVAEIIPLGPAAVAGIRVGDTVASVDGQPLTASTNIDERLQHTIDKRVTVGVTGATGTTRDVALRPVNLTTEKGLLYRSWVEDTRALVAKLSGGRLGYAHMPDMSAQSLEQFFIDLDVDNFAKDGVVIDVRNNNGGFVNVYAIDVLARRSFFDMTVRGSSRVPSRSVLGQRALERPTILLTNQHSLSDAEDFTEGYRSLKLGRVVGEPTAGWIIYTWNVPMFDGSVLRLPRMRITAADGSDMEMHPRPVDVPVSRVLGEWSQGRDSQIEIAVKELLSQLAGAPTARRQ